MYRIGTGYDVHAFAEGRLLMLGGVRIPHDRGLAGHSDADVLLHAVGDALLGAAALGDLGQIFPPDDSAFANADSQVMLRTVVELVREKGWCAENVDVTVIAERPRLTPHVPQMRANLASLLVLPMDATSVKATTTEGLGFAGREEGIAAQAVVLLRRI